MYIFNTVRGVCEGYKGKGQIILATCGQSLNLEILFDACVSKMRTDKHQVSILYKNIFY